MGIWLQLAASKHPDRVALQAPSGRLTYAELAKLASGTATALQSAGIKGGDRVGLELEDAMEFVVALHACLVMGAPAVPIDLRLGEGERNLWARGTATVLRGGLPTDPAAPWTVADPDDAAIATVMHTSGSTSSPKPVELSYGNWLAGALGSAVALGLDPEERWLCPMPLTHVGGLSIPIRSVVYATTAVVHGRFETDAVLAELMDPARRITVVSLVPTMLARLLEAGLHNPPSLRWALLGGGPIAPGLLERADAAGVPVAPSYGMTEACSQIATFGWPLPGVEIGLDDGEVIVRGATVARSALAEDGWLHTGDLGRFDGRGRLELMGRRSETIITGGENVSPAEVEAVLLEHPAVADAAVWGRPDPEWGEAVRAIVVRRDGLAVEGEELRAFCARRLAAFKVPKTVDFTDRLPRTTSGKLLRRELDGLV